MKINKKLIVLTVMSSMTVNSMLPVVRAVYSENEKNLIQDNTENCIEYRRHQYDNAEVIKKLKEELIKYINDTKNSVDFRSYCLSVLIKLCENINEYQEIYRHIESNVSELNQVFNENLLNEGFFDLFYRAVNLLLNTNLDIRAVDSKNPELLFLKSVIENGINYLKNILNGSIDARNLIPINKLKILQTICAINTSDNRYFSEYKNIFNSIADKINIESNMSDSISRKCILHFAKIPGEQQKREGLDYLTDLIEYHRETGQGLKNAEYREALLAFAKIPGDRGHEESKLKYLSDLIEYYGRIRQGLKKCGV